MERKHADYLVQSGNPKALDELLQTMGAYLFSPEKDIYPTTEGCYTMRIFNLGLEGYIKFACESQGYCKIVRKVEDNE